MTDLPKPEVILTHESDLDGFVSGLLLQRLAERLFGVRPPLQAFHNNNWRQRAPLERAAWVSDLAFEPRLDRLNWLIVDHHATEAAPRYARLIHDISKSAGLLAYELCRQCGLDSPELDRIVHLNNVADLFLVEDPDFALASDYANLVKTYQFWNLHELVQGQLERLLDHPLLEVMTVKRRVEDPLGLAWSKANITRLSATVGYVDTVIGNSNLIVHQLLEPGAAPYPVLLTLFRKGNGTMIASVRSRDGQALIVAEKLKGGGHANAAGAVLPRSVQNFPAAIDYLKQTLDPTPSKTTPLNGLEGIFKELEAGEKTAP
jgi:hypothetical protein